MAKQAKQGGEKGINNEWYEGGQFLPSSPRTVKGEANQAKTTATPRKQEIAPYKWETSNKQSIWTQVNTIATFHKTGYSKETGSQGTLEWNEDFNWQALGWSEENASEAKSLIIKWNNGQRWI